MNIMDKDEIIRISNLIIKGQVPLSEALKVISEYCYEHNKNAKNIEQFLTIIGTNTIMVGSYLKYALDYFKGKYEICTLYDKESNTILNF